jgi:hypothetical protein
MRLKRSQKNSPSLSLRRQIFGDKTSENGILNSFVNASTYLLSTL